MMDEALKNRWTDALRSGAYAQTTGALRRDGGFCCLGVLADVCGKTWEWVDGSWLLEGKALDLSPEFRLDLDVRGENYSTLVMLNDEKKATFEEIADWIEENL